MKKTASKKAKPAAKKSNGAEIRAAVDDLGASIQTLNEKIVDLRNAPGDNLPEDQAVILAGQSVTEKFKAVDTLTAPKA